MTCSRCGAFACAACATSYDYLPFCQACYARLPHAAPYSRQAAVALGFGILGGLLCFPLGLVGVVLGQIELSKIDAGESPHGGRGMALGAIVFGAIGLVMSVALVLLGVGVLLVLEH